MSQASWTAMRIGGINTVRPEAARSIPQGGPSRASRRASVRNMGHSTQSHPLMEDSTAFIESIRGLAPELDSESEISMDDEYVLSGVRASQYHHSRDTKPFLSNSNTFKMIAGGIIMANTVVIALEAIYIQQQLLLFDRLELAFTAFYTVEISWRMWERGVFVFLSADDWWWNWFDLVITALSVADTALSEMTGSSSGASVGRLFRVFRILRMFRAMKFLNEVDYVLAQAATATLKLAAIVTLVLFVSSIIATNMLWDSRDPIVAEIFANLPSSMWTLFKLMTLDDWQSVCERVIKVKPGMLMFFVVFIFTTSIALISLVPAIFIELSLSSRKREEELSEAKEGVILRREKKRLLHTLFKLTDRNGNGKVSVEEMKMILTNDGYLRKLQESGLTGPGELRDVRLGLFDLWEESFEESARTDFEISEEEFINGLLKVRENVSQAVLWRCITATRLMLRDLSAHMRKELQRMDTKSGNLEREIRGLIKAATADILTSQERIRYTMTRSPMEGSRGSTQEFTSGSDDASVPLGGPTSIVHEDHWEPLGYGPKTAEELDTQFEVVTGMMRHLQRQETELMMTSLSEPIIQSASEKSVSEKAAAPTPAAPTPAPAESRKPAVKTKEKVPFNSAKLRSKRSVEFDEEVVHLTDHQSRWREDSAEMQVDNPVLNLVSDEDLPLVPKDVPSADMFESEGLSTEAAYLL